jgi:hypothetical protein
MITSSIWGDVAQNPVLQRLSKSNEILTNRARLAGSVENDPEQT